MDLIENDCSFSEPSADDEYETKVYYDNDEESSSSSSQDWDALLDSYGRYVDKYISLMKKDSKGDMSAMI